MTLALPRALTTVCVLPLFSGNCPWGLGGSVRREDHGFTQSDFGFLIQASDANCHRNIEHQLLHIHESTIARADLEDCLKEIQS